MVVRTQRRRKILREQQESEDKTVLTANYRKADDPDGRQIKNQIVVRSDDRGNLTQAINDNLRRNDLFGKGMFYVDCRGHKYHGVSLDKIPQSVYNELREDTNDDFLVFVRNKTKDEKQPSTVGKDSQLRVLSPEQRFAQIVSGALLQHFDDVRRRTRKNPQLEREIANRFGSQRYWRRMLSDIIFDYNLVGLARQIAAERIPQRRRRRSRRYPMTLNQFGNDISDSINAAFNRSPYGEFTRPSGDKLSEGVFPSDEENMKHASLVLCPGEILCHIKRIFQGVASYPSCDKPDPCEESDPCHKSDPCDEPKSVCSWDTCDKKIVEDTHACQQEQLSCYKPMRPPCETEYSEPKHRCREKRRCVRFFQGFDDDDEMQKTVLANRCKAKKDCGRSIMPTKKPVFGKEPLDSEAVTEKQVFGGEPMDEDLFLGEEPMDLKEVTDDVFLGTEPSSDDEFGEELPFDDEEEEVFEGREPPSSDEEIGDDEFLFSAIDKRQDDDDDDMLYSDDDTSDEEMFETGIRLGKLEFGAPQTTTLQFGL